MLRNKVNELNSKYEELKHQINLEKASGSLSKLFNLEQEFDETFDQFFDDEALRKKYNDFDHENDCILFEKTGRDMLEEFDEEDLKSYVEFYEGYVETLEDELKELKGC